MNTLVELTAAATEAAQALEDIIGAAGGADPYTPDELSVFAGNAVDRLQNALAEQEVTS